MACVMPMLVNKGSTSTIEERKTMVDTFLCGASRIARPITINRSTIRKSMPGSKIRFPKGSNGGIYDCTT